jgi:hypothetical protein
MLLIMDGYVGYDGCLFWLFCLYCLATLDGSANSSPWICWLFIMAILDGWQFLLCCLGFMVALLARPHCWLSWLDGFAGWIYILAMLAGNAG